MAARNRPFGAGNEKSMKNEIENPLYPSATNPWVLLLALTLISIGGLFFIGQVLAWGFVTVITGSTSAYMDLMRNPMADPETRWILMVVQGLNHVGGFLIAPLIFYFTLVKGRFFKDFFRPQANMLMVLLLTLMVSFSFMIVDTIFIEWNESIVLPESLSALEQWARNLEDSMKELTVYLTKFDSAGYFLLAVVVVAVLPGIGEELIFRGLLQNIFLRMNRNPHFAIWLAAFFFSAIHFQFFGFLPRMLLGALFGYLYYWTGNLIVPVVAHFFNNFFSLLALYAYQKGLTDIDPETAEALPMTYIIAFGVLFIVLIVYFKNYVSTHKENMEDDRMVGSL